MPNLFKFCPSCKSPAPDFLDGKEIICRVCGWNYFHNVAAAAAVFIVTAGNNKKSAGGGTISAGNTLLFIRRNVDPGKGLLDLPGGFVDPAESAEEAIRREAMEELGVTLLNLRYFVSYPNRYLYADVWYNTCDLYFRAEIGNDVLNPNIKEIEAVEFIAPEEYSNSAFTENLAFDSAKKALREFAAILE